MKTVYIACPYTKGDVAVNVRNAILMAEKVREAGFLPFVPILTHFWHFMSPHPYEYWTSMDLEWLHYCDCILRIPGESSGADAELDYNRMHLGKSVYYDIASLVERELV